MILSEENLSLSNVQQLHIFEEQTTQGFHHTQTISLQVRWNG